MWRVLSLLFNSANLTSTASQFATLPSNLPHLPHLSQISLFSLERKKKKKITMCLVLFFEAITQHQEVPIMKLKVQITNQEVIGMENYEPTQLEDVFVNLQEGSICVIGKEEAVVLKP